MYEVWVKRHREWKFVEQYRTQAKADRIAADYRARSKQRVEVRREHFCAKCGTLWDCRNMPCDGYCHDCQCDTTDWLSGFYGAPSLNMVKVRQG